VRISESGRVQLARRSLSFLIGQRLNASAARVPHRADDPTAGRGWAAYVDG
jgi:hypothetical protein